MRYLSGMPSDSLLFLFASGKSVLSPWDINLAEQYATADEIIPYTEFGRSLPDAVPGIISLNKIEKKSKIELTSRIPHPVFMEIKKGSPKWKWSAARKGLTALLKKRGS